MAIRIPIISDFQDQGIKQAKLAFGNFKTAVRDAEGGLGKFKAGATSVMDSVKANAATFAVAGGAAFVAFAAQGIKAFQDVALEAGKFAAATGLQVEDASRWREVAGDIGIGADSLQTSIGKMNTEIGKNPKLFRDLGVDLVYMDDGALDVNATFLNTIQHLKDIKDPAQRAKEGVKLLGRGWKDMAQFIEMGSTSLEDSLKKVSSSKIITPEELQRARDFRDTMNDFKDHLEDVIISFGQVLLPIIDSAVKHMEPLMKLLSFDVGGFGIPDAIGAVTDEALKLVNPISYFKTTWEDINGVFEDGASGRDRLVSGLQTMASIVPIVGTGVSDLLGFFHSGGEKDIPVFAGAMRDAREDNKQFAELIRDQTNPQLEQLETKMINAKTATDNAKAAWGNLIGQFERQVSFDKLDTDIDTLKEKAIAAFGGGKAEMDAFHEMQLTVAQDFEKFATNFPPALSTEITVAINSGDIAQLEYAASLVKFVSAPIGSGGNDPSITRRVSNPITGHRASGGPVMGGKSYLVGERGPELFTPGTSGGITPNSALAGGTNITVNVNGGDPNSIVRALQQYVRQVGPVPVNTRAM